MIPHGECRRLTFVGSGLSIFGSVLQEIFYFKPQTIVSQSHVGVLVCWCGKSSAF